MPHPDHEKNRATWNKQVDLHVYHKEYKTKEVIAGGSSLKQIELDALGDVRGKSLLHLMCQFGLDTLSWARQGARVTGVDISERSVEVAREITQQAGLQAEFVRSDVLDLIGRIDKQFDIVYQSYGTHIWLSDLFQWAKVVAQYLKPGGTFYMIDEHPVNILFLPREEDYPPDYFATEPERTLNPNDYCEQDVHIEGEEHVEWQHPVSKIVNALIEAGLTIERLDEYNYYYYKYGPDWIPYAGHDGFWLPPDGKPATYPLMLAVKARK
ncbi:methyltransferase domain-containing protein [candidate division GN15 bacterium]|nr:methyltransferase domain-containing protein [candidate division GN15 bacterium]